MIIFHSGFVPESLNNQNMRKFLHSPGTLQAEFKSIFGQVMRHFNHFGSLINLTVCLVLAACPLFAQTPPVPPPDRYVKPVLEKINIQLNSGEETPFLKIDLQEVFNLPNLSQIEGDLKEKAGFGEIEKLRLAVDINKNDRLDSNETVLSEAVPNDTGFFCFEEVDTAIEDDSQWLLLASISSAVDPQYEFDISFQKDAFQGENTFFDFSGCTFERITVDVEEPKSEANLPKSFHLFQNYPNPFNPETHFQLAVPKQGRVRLSIYNILGQEVAVLVDKNYRAGWHPIVWDGRDKSGCIVPTGVYIGWAAFGKSHVTVKMLMIR